MTGALGLTVKALTELPHRAVVLDRDSTAWQLDTGEGYWASAGDECLTSKELRAQCRPLVLLFDPRTSRHAPVVGQMVLPVAKR